jgi:hypothetical protein
MSFYDDASWLLIPEGIEEDIVYAQKPTNGLGDLTFTRASDATRTNSAGVIERTPWNLVTWSEMFSDVAWSKSNTIITANTTTAPNGTLTADTWTGNGTLSAKYVIQTAPIVSGRSYSLSVYAKKNTNNFIQLIAGAATFGLNGYANFDLNNGVIGTVGANATATIENAGNGWYRCIIRCTSTVTTTGNAHVVSLITSATSPADEANTLSTSVFLWGAQLVEGTDAKPYFATTNRQDVPRLDYRNADGSLNSCPRLLLEPQRTNSIRNSTMVGAVAGTPGTLPTNWSQSGAGGLTQTVVGTGTESGIQYIDIRFSGTSTTTLVRIILEPSGVIAGTVGQTFTWSNYLKFIATPSAPNSTRLRITERNSGGGSLTQGDFTVAPTTTLQRFAYTRANTDATCAFVSPEVTFVLTSGATYDFTIRIAAPQMELGAYATTFIPTTTTAVSRTADAFTRNNIYTNDLISAAGGTWFVEISDNLPVLRDSPAGVFIGDSLNSNTGNQIIIRNASSSGAARFSIIRYIAGTSTVLFTTTTSKIKIAIKWNGTSMDIFVNGVKQVSASSFTTTIMQNMVALAGQIFEIDQMSLAPTPLSDAECIARTTL